MNHWDLIAKEFSGELSDEERTQLTKWIAQSEENKKEYEASKQAWSLVDKEGIYQPNVDVAWKKVIAKTDTSKDVISKPKGKSYWIAAVFIGIVVLGTVLNYWLNSPSITTLTASNEVKEYSLPDGSHIWLNKNSELSYTEDFNKKNREVKLNGEAYFEVAKNAEKPFLIESKRSKVKVLGTSFSVKAYDSLQQVVLVVEEGKVSFSSNQDEKIFEAGEKGIMYENLVIGKYTTINPNNLAWKRGFFEYENAQLKDVFFDLEEHFKVSFSVKDITILQCKFTGQLSAQNLDELVEVLSLTNSLEIKKNDSELSIAGKGC